MPSFETKALLSLLAGAGAYLGFLGDALAEPSFAFAVSKTECKLTGGTKQESANAITVTAEADAGLTLESYDFKSGTTQLSKKPFDQSVKPPIAKISGPFDKAIEMTVNVKDAAGTAAAVSCKANLGDKPPAKPEALPKATLDPVVDRLALQTWKTDGKRLLDELRAEGEAKGLDPDTQFLVHLPSGAPAFPFASSYREGTPLQVVVLLPSTQIDPIEVTVTVCADVQTFRLKPSEDGKQAAEDEERVTFVLAPMGSWFRCGGGTAIYTLKVGTGDNARTSTATLRMRNVYHFAANLVVGYDTAPTSSFGTTGSETTRVVSESKDRIGFAGYIGGVWMVGGVDYEDMRWYNYFLNPFIAVNPTSPTKDVIAGLALTPTGGISLAVGVGIHERTVLKGYAVGSAFSGDGAVPTEETWSGLKPGFFIGAAVDSNVYNAVKALGSAK